jgi:hypothetical protein
MVVVSLTMSVVNVVIRDVIVVVSVVVVRTVVTALFEGNGAMGTSLKLDRILGESTLAEVTTAIKTTKIACFKLKNYHCNVERN